MKTRESEVDLQIGNLMKSDKHAILWLTYSLEIEHSEERVRFRGLFTVWKSTISDENPRF